MSFKVYHTGFFKRVFHLNHDGRDISSLHTHCLLFKKEFTFDHHHKTIRAEAQNKWRNITLWDGSEEIAKVSRTNTGIFSNDNYVLAMKDTYDDAILIRIVEY